MLKQPTIIRSALCRASSLLLAVAFFSTPATAVAGIIWSGDFDSGNFRQWHSPDDTQSPYYWGIPQYGRPAQQPGDTSQSGYYGNGELLQLVTSPVRQGVYAAKFTVKNSINGSEPADCDSGGKNCVPRRTELWAKPMLSDVYNAIPYLGTRWVSVSVFIPKDWNTGGSGWGPIVFQMKPRNESGLSPTIAIEAGESGWELWHRWAPNVDPSRSDVPWQQAMYYGSVYPTAKDWPDGLLDMPDVAVSRAALADLNMGGWTDWVINFKSDARGSAEGGTGFIKAWKRKGDGPWIQVLFIRPKVTTRGGMTFDHGIMYNSPAASNNGGFCVQVGLYMQKEQVWALPANRVVIIDNVKVGDENTTFAAMSPDGSSPGEMDARPQAPKEISVN